MRNTSLYQLLNWGSVNGGSYNMGGIKDDCMTVSSTIESIPMSRRSVVAMTGGLAGLGYAAGRLSINTNSVNVLAAGSLAHTFEDYIGPAFGEDTEISVHGEYYGANAVMRFVEDRTKHPDVIVSADSTLLRDRLYGEFTDWDIEFATNSLGIGYNDEALFGERLEDGDPWFELALQSEDGEISIGDPDLDPLGYRAVQAFELVEDKYDLGDFRDKVVELVYKEPDEPAMMAGVETGSRAASIVYRNMAVDHEMPFYEFPDEYNFANPELADHYATVKYTTNEEGYTAEGRPILYNATVNDDADKPNAGLQFVQFLIDNPGLLEEAGLTVGNNLPRAEGSVPEEISV